MKIDLSKKELSVLIHALNVINSRDEKAFKDAGVSVSDLYNKIYSIWEETVV